MATKFGYCRILRTDEIVMPEASQSRVGLVRYLQLYNKVITKIAQVGKNRRPTFPESLAELSLQGASQ